MAARRLLFMFFLAVFLASTSSKVSAGDPDMLQDLCVADLNSSKIYISNICVCVGSFLLEKEKKKKKTSF